MHQSPVCTPQARITTADRDKFLALFYQAEQTKEPKERERLLMGAAQASPETWASIGNALMSAGQNREALRYFREALRYVRPDRPHVRGVILLNIGTLLTEFGEREAGLKCYMEANELYPRMAVIEGSIAICKRWREELTEAEQWINRAVVHADRHTIDQAEFSKGLILLTAGKLKEGWKYYEARFKNPASKVAKIALDKPQWCGQDLAGKYLMLYAEQGHGDTFQFIRYAKIIKDKWPSVRLIFGAQTGQERILKTLPYLDGVVGVHEKIPDTAALDYVCPLLSCPRLLGTDTPEQIPWFGPYIPQPEPMPLKGALKVGICWAGSVAHQHDLWRSTRLADWRPVLDVPGCNFYSVVTGPRSIERVEDPRIQVCGEDVSDWMDTARLIAGLDLLISVDTGPVHLAGAMGKPVWCLVQFGPDFRWMTGRSDSPWYPSLRLYRGKKDFEWAPVLERVAADLAAKVSD